MRKISFIRFGALLSVLVAATVGANAQAASPDDAVKTALTVGDAMPSFALKDVEGKSVSSSDLLKAGNLVIVFYRGSWCPYCNSYLHKMQGRLAEITAAGGKLVAISVEDPDASMAIAKKNELKYTVLSDPGLEVAKKFKIVYSFSAELDKTYKGYGLDVAKHNQMEKPELPLAATYVVDRSGKITYAFLVADYTKRADPEAVIENLKTIKK
jgi:peroxiredoxin